jgi:putative Mg2+ transporter-C (MgtC) family protein
MMPSETELVLRILFAALAGLVLGVDRDWKNKPVDFRAYAIVSATAAMIAIVSLQLMQDTPNPDKSIAMDPLRTLQSVLMSIGFLGAGVMMQRDGTVIGTATGASIWAAGALGVAIGLGYYAYAFTGFVCILVLLVVFGWLMPAVEGKKDNKRK